MYEHNALGYWSGLALCLTKVRSSRARCPALALINILKNILCFFVFFCFRRWLGISSPFQLLKKRLSPTSFTWRKTLKVALIRSIWRACQRKTWNVIYLSELGPVVQNFVN